MAINAKAVAELRATTGAGVMDAKKALTEAKGDADKAVSLLKERGLAKAAKKDGRTASEGIVHSYIHGDGRIGVLLELNCETDFVARGSDFKTLATDLCLHVAANNPAGLTAIETGSDNTALLTQPFVKDPATTVEAVLAQHIAKLGENIQIARFTRYELGE